MKKIVGVLLTVLALPTSPASAQDDPNAEILKQLYTQIVRNIDLRRQSLDDTTNQYMFVLTQPGIFIDPALLNANGTENTSQKRIFSEIIDRVMRPSWVYSPIDETYHEYFEIILNNYEYKSLPLTDVQQEALAEANALLFNEDGSRTTKYERYVNMQNTYREAMQAVDAYLNTNPGAATIPEHISADIELAMTDWLAVGSKNEVETAREALYRYNPEGLWSDARTDYNRTPATASLHNYYPGVSTWLRTNNQWPSIKVSWSKNSQSTHSRETSSSGGASFSAFGFFSVGGSGDERTVNRVDQNEANSIEIDMEYLRVDFRRPWLTRAVFSDTRWRFACGTEPAIQQQVVSSGPISQQDAVVYPSGLMPMIPTGFLIARNVKVTGDFSENFSSYYNRVISQSGSSGWGPFSIRGSYNDAVTNTQVEGQTAENGFTVGHPQIIGFFVEVLPTSPNPQPGLFTDCQGVAQ